MNRIEPHVNLVALRMNAHAQEIVAKGEPASQIVYPVVDEAGRIAGIITPDEIAILSSEPDLLLLVNAADLMRPTVSVDLEDDLGFGEFGEDEIPFVHCRPDAFGATKRPRWERW